MLPTFIFDYAGSSFLEPEPPTLGAPSLNHWTTREVPKCPIKKIKYTMMQPLEGMTYIHQKVLLRTFVSKI